MFDRELRWLQIFCCRSISYPCPIFEPAQLDTTTASGQADEPELNMVYFESRIF